MAAAGDEGRAEIHTQPRACAHAHPYRASIVDDIFAGTGAAGIEGAPAIEVVTQGEAAAHTLAVSYDAFLTAAARVASAIAEYFGVDNSRWAGIHGQAEDDGHEAAVPIVPITAKSDAQRVYRVSGDPQPCIICCIDGGIAWPLLWLASLASGGVLVPLDIRNEPVARAAAVVRDAVSGGAGRCVVIADTADEELVRVVCAVAGVVPGVVAVDRTCAAATAAAAAAAAAAAEAPLSRALHNALRAMAAAARGSTATSDGCAARSVWSRSASPPPTLSHIFFTSGTTGVPKGVVGTHVGLTVYSRAHAGRFYPNSSGGDGGGVRTLLVSSHTFDPSLGDMLATWWARGTLVIIEPRHALHADLAGCIERAKITHCTSTPAVFRTVLARERPLVAPQLRCVALGGEALPPAFVRCFAEWTAAGHCHAKLVNLYGATEATVYQTAYRANSGHTTDVSPAGRHHGGGSSNGGIYLGRPLSRATTVFVLLPTPAKGGGAAAGKPAAARERILGELWVCGAQVTLGYLRNSGDDADAGPAAATALDARRGFAVTRPDDAYAVLPDDIAQAVWHDGEGAATAPAADDNAAAAASPAVSWWSRNCFRTGDVVEVVAAGAEEPAAAEPAAGTAGCVYLLRRNATAGKDLELVRVLAPTEQLRMVGRKDTSLVKIRGRRFELQEIESVLRERLAPAGLLHDVAVSVHNPDAPGAGAGSSTDSTLLPPPDRRLLVAYCVVPSAVLRVAPEDAAGNRRAFALYRDLLRAVCEGALPRYMVPAMCICFVEGCRSRDNGSDTTAPPPAASLPCTRNGKVDKRVLGGHPKIVRMLRDGRGGGLSVAAASARDHHGDASGGGDRNAAQHAAVMSTERFVEMFLNDDGGDAAAADGGVGVLYNNDGDDDDDRHLAEHDIPTIGAWVLLLAEAWCEVVLRAEDALAGTIRRVLQAARADGAVAHAVSAICRLRLDFHANSGGDSLVAVRVCRFVAARVAPHRTDVDPTATGAFGELLPQPLLPRELLQRPVLTEFARHLHASYEGAAGGVLAGCVASKGASQPPPPPPPPASSSASPPPPATAAAARTSSGGTDAVGSAEIAAYFALLRKACARGAGGPAVVRWLGGMIQSAAGGVPRRTAAEVNGSGIIAAAWEGLSLADHPFYLACAANRPEVACIAWSLVPREVADGPAPSPYNPRYGLVAERHFETLLRLVGEGATSLDTVRVLFGDAEVVARYQQQQVPARTDATPTPATPARPPKKAGAGGGGGGTTAMLFVDKAAAAALSRRRDAHGQTLLHRCARGGGSTKVLDYLALVYLSVGAGGAGRAGSGGGGSLDALKDDYGRTPLHWAVINGHESLVKRLADDDLQCNATSLRDAQGETALEMAERRAVCAAADLRVQGKNQSVWGSIAKLLGGSGGTKNLKKTGKM